MSTPESFTYSLDSFTSRGARKWFSSAAEFSWLAHAKPAARTPSITLLAGATRRIQEDFS